MEKIEVDHQLEQVESNVHHEDKTRSSAELRGRAIQGQERNRSYLQALRKDPKLMFWIGVMLWTLIVRGFENQASGSIISIPYFKQRFGMLVDGDYFVATTWQSALSGGSNGAAIIGALASSYLADWIGVKPTIIGFSALNMVSVGIEFATTSIGMFLAGKLLNFVAIGAFLNLCTAYVADVSPLAIRASTIGFCNLSQCIGPFVAAIMANFTQDWDNDMSWKSLIIAQWAFCGVAFIALLFLPECPVHLVRKNKLEAARHSLGRLYSDPADADGHLETIKLTLEEAEVQRKSSYVECFRGTNLRRTMIAIFVFLSEPMAGLGFVSSTSISFFLPQSLSILTHKLTDYGALMYQYLDISDAESFRIQIGAQILSISGATIAFLVGDFYGRRPMFLIGCASLTALLFCMGISGSINTPAAVTASVGFYTMVRKSLQSYPNAPPPTNTKPVQLRLQRRRRLHRLLPCRRNPHLRPSPKDARHRPLHLGRGQHILVLCLAVHFQPRLWRPQGQDWLRVWRVHDCFLRAGLVLCAGDEDEDV